MQVECRHCHEKTEVPVTDEQVKRWQHGELIQRVMPHLSAGQRELLMTRTCGDCFDKMFQKSEEEIE